MAVNKNENGLNLLSQASPFCNCLIYYEKVIIRLLFVI